MYKGKKLKDISLVLPPKDHLTFPFEEFALSISLTRTSCQTRPAIFPALDL